MHLSKTIPSTLKILEVWLVYKSLCLSSYNIDFFPQMVFKHFFTMFAVDFRYNVPLLSIFN